MSNRSRRQAAEAKRRHDLALVLGAGVAVLALVAGIVALVVTSGGGGAPTVAVALEDYAFSPQPLSVPAGSALDVTNVGQLPHDLVVDRAGRGTPDLAAGARHELPLDGVAPGTYRIYCSLPGHVELGMEGTLTITAS